METKDSPSCNLCGGPVRPAYGNMCKACAEKSLTQRELSDDGLKAWMPKTAPVPPSCELGVADDGGHIAAALDIPGGWTRESVRITLKRAAETVASLTTALAAEKEKTRAGAVALDFSSKTIRKLTEQVATNRATANERILELERMNADLEKELSEAPSRADVNVLKDALDSEKAHSGSVWNLRQEVLALRAQLALAESRRAPARHRPGPQVSVGWDPEGE